VIYILEISAAFREFLDKDCSLFEFLIGKISQISLSGFDIKPPHPPFWDAK